MRVLVTGGSGNVGQDLVPALLAGGHEVVVLDRDLAALSARPHPRLHLVAGAVEDRARVEEAIRGAEAVIHMAWSFSEDPATLLERDLRGHQLLLDASRAAKVKHFVYTSTAVVYGKPVRVPIDEGHPLRLLEARKPSYGIAKDFAEKLALLAGRTGGPPATILRFWWAFGASIGGRHLREMLRTAAGGKPLLVPASCGGSFVSMEDLGQAIGLVLCNPAAFGQVFNVASDYVTWEEVARMAAQATGSAAGVEVVPPERWTGAAFLADAWHLDDRLIRERLGFRPVRGPAALRDLLGRAIARAWDEDRALRPAP
jgi:UDP-glucose 4-epimerase